jgi:regulator of protease activity HflC (stomatin/prohibitin superfamily)
LMKTLTDRKIAEEQEVTFETQKKAQVQRQTLEKETAIADMQAEVVKADQGVQIAERHADASVKKAKGDAESVKISASANAEATKMKAQADATKTTLIGKAEADATLAKGQADAESYRLAVDAMGKENFTTFKVTEEIGRNNIKIMPDMLIGGGQNGGGGPMEGLLGLQILDMMGKKINKEDDVKDVTSEEVKPTNKK